MHTGLLTALTTALIVPFAMLPGAAAGHRAGPVTLYVAIGGSDHGPCSQAAPCETIGHAVDAAAGGSTVKIGKGLFDETAGIFISKSLTLVGAGELQTRVEPLGGGPYPAVTIENGAVVHIAELEIENTTSASNTTNRPHSCAVDNRASLDLTNVRVAGNSPGLAAVCNYDLLVVDRSEIAENHYVGLDNEGRLAIVARSMIDLNEGEGIENGDGHTLSIVESTIDRNQAPSTRVGSSYNTAGAIDNAGMLSLTNVTVAGNVGYWVGGLESSGPATLVNVTIANNRAVDGHPGDAVEAGGITVEENGTLHLSNTIVAENLMPAIAEPSNFPLQCAVQGGASLQSDASDLTSDNTCTEAFPGSGSSTPLVGNPKLGPLRFNGGPTATLALLAGSPAIDAGSNARCPKIDQRGVARPQDGNGDGKAVCDIGAYELNP